eukprot:CAMPEP_0194136470 /NCGR_PEP_ID=MMETSP0152-20130528/6486_1 /TAXON_ID=1049557 /ORGANISM="Thalassiothrix antarctica, Strain L6-D1" /LENGTH=226 /DNA_ID=CAMNT_0038833143 /DNA_START=244 /DNA_END=924 /DNA_ORIENTATION=+
MAIPVPKTSDTDNDSVLVTADEVYFENGEDNSNIPITVEGKMLPTTKTMSSSNVVDEPISSSTIKNSRKFVSYTSSEFELLWLNHVTEWTDSKAICDVITSTNYSPYMHDFLNATCTSRYLYPYANWCIIDDEYRPMYYNTANCDTFEIQWSPPLENPKMAKDGYPLQVEDSHPKPFEFTSDLEHVFSKFVFYDEETQEQHTEYIAPLVSHLSFPLAMCLNPGGYL